MASTIGYEYDASLMVGKKTNINRISWSRPFKVAMKPKKKDKGRGKEKPDLVS